MKLGSIVIYHVAAQHGAAAYDAAGIISKVNADGSFGVTVFNPSQVNEYVPSVSADALKAV